ncbi:queuosine precursor transporter [Microvirga tunisiensis]|uniref:Queuosine transporter n=2 Tax=Pannonibacter tanglangensis TaxID=2750084 RepID=A0ABW9ZQL5_9HYPH|nr:MULTISPECIES: queuosine precursor transporter [unclassified Pannonibacter]NBN65871.1 queuosine precursor transporter [Pannonibacter sp. XCT-34]NBN80389.1 queuosine precursor transporter [Pannonibacter sp. XCT-53]
MNKAETFSAGRIAIAVTAMAIVVLASNYLVQFPVQGTLGGIVLADLLTWGAFTYPAAFLVTDLTNRRFGPQAARQVVYAGFVLAVALSIWLATPRIAIASGTAFLVAQLLDVTVFNRLRQATWWKAPFISSLLGSIVDTLIFFSIAFSPLFGGSDAFALELAPLFGVFATDVPRWISWALGDFTVKMLVAIALLAPYRVLMAILVPAPQQSAA